jgi:hypothetical protein
LLIINQLVVDTVDLLKKLVMGSLLSNLAFLQDKDMVSLSDSGQSMSDDDSRDGLEFFLHLLDRLLHFHLVLFVQSAGCLVKDQELRLLDESSRERDSLLLTA